MDAQQRICHQAARSKYVSAEPSGRLTEHQSPEFLNLAPEGCNNGVAERRGDQLARNDVARFIVCSEGVRTIVLLERTVTAFLDRDRKLAAWRKAISETRHQHAMLPLCYRPPMGSNTL